MKVDTTGRDPALSVTVPDGPPDDRSFKILLPEHVTVRAHGQSDAQHLYIYGHDPASKAPQWKKAGNSLAYETDFGQIHFAVSASSRTRSTCAGGEQRPGGGAFGRGVAPPPYAGPAPP